MSIETVIVVTVIALCLVLGLYLNLLFSELHEKLDTILDRFDGLRTYLYEMDPQFDDEREALGAFFSDSSAGKDHIDLLKRKRELGKRTLDTLFDSGGRDGGMRRELNAAAEAKERRPMRLWPTLRSWSLPWRRAKPAAR